jgi:hypothetical protein
MKAARIRPADHDSDGPDDSGGWPGLRPIPDSPSFVWLLSATLSAYATRRPGCWPTWTRPSMSAGRRWPLSPPTIQDAPRGCRTSLFRSNLGLALETRFGLLGAPTDLDKAIDMGRQAFAAAVADPPARATFLLNLGDALLTRYEHFGAPADLTAAIEADRDTVAVKLASPRLRAWAARSWGRAAAAGQRWSEASKVLRQRSTWWGEWCRAA